MSNPDDERVPFWQDPKKLGYVYQTVTVALLVFAISYLYSNTVANLEKQNIASGFAFLDRVAGFDISESLFLEYWPNDTYAKALLVGILNTFKVAVVGNILAVILGTIVGVLGLSKNWLLAKMCRVYVETLRNIPLLLQLFLWYTIFTEIFPAVKSALNPLPHVFISQRGFYYPVPDDPVWKWVLVAFALAAFCSYAVKWWGGKHQENTGKKFPVGKVSAGLLIGLPLLTWLAGGAPTKLDVPELAGFNFKGGGHLSPEYLALLFGLVLYTSSFISEIVRAGIESVKKGQWEAANALGLKGGQVMGLVILPQALRVIVPPTTSQLLNLTKNSSLAVAIGYPDFVSVANTSLNQTGQAIELVSLLMAVYLMFSLSTSAFMNWYNKRITLVER